MDPKKLSISDFQYDLPPERIALFPLSERDAGKLLIYRGRGVPSTGNAGRTDGFGAADPVIAEDVYRNIDHHLPAGSLLVFNNTRVVEARIVFQKASGGQIEIFCLEPSPEYGGIAAALMQTGSVRWKCLIGGASKWKPGQVLTRRIVGNGHGISGHHPAGNELVLEAKWIGKLEGAFLIGLSWSPPELSFSELLHRAGLIPLPPYIRRQAESSDKERYQTVYARHEGSVAAPTAGLHFTPSIFEKLAVRGIDRAFVTLHVGAGTFMPVKSDIMERHVMHAEFIDVDRATIQTLATRRRGLIIPVGTTSVRTIESLYWLGVKTIRDPHLSPAGLVVHQWDAYEQEGEPPVDEALGSLLSWMERAGQEHLLTQTQLLITPGYKWQLAKGLVTNFHQPGSTLLLLVAALIGEDWRKLYRYALDHDFRFLSYGDGCLLLPGGPGE